MNSISLPLNFTGRLFKAQARGMHTLFYFWTRRGVFCWDKKWTITHWRRFGELRDYFEDLQKGYIRISNKLEFLLETGKSFDATFENVDLLSIMKEYEDVVMKYNDLWLKLEVGGKNG